MKWFASARKQLHTFAIILISLCSIEQADLRPRSRCTTKARHVIVNADQIATLSRPKEIFELEVHLYHANFDLDAAMLKLKSMYQWCNFRFVLHDVSMKDPNFQQLDMCIAEMLNSISEFAGDISLIVEGERLVYDVENTSPYGRMLFDTLFFGTFKACYILEVRGISLPRKAVISEMKRGKQFFSGYPKLSNLTLRQASFNSFWILPKYLNHCWVSQDGVEIEDIEDAPENCKMHPYFAPYANPISPQFEQFVEQRNANIEINKLV